MAYKLGRTKWEPVPGKPNVYRIVVEVALVLKNNKLGKAVSVSVEQDMLNSEAKTLLKAKLRNEIASLEVKMKVRSVAEEVVEELKAEYPEEFV